MTPSPARPPRCEQLLTEEDLQVALKAAERPECLDGCDVLDRFILKESAAIMHAFVGAGVPASMAVELSRRTARAARASALAVAASLWREILPATPGTPSDGR